MFRILAALAALAGLASSAYGDGNADAANLERGVALFTAGDFAGALAPLKTAHEADPVDADTALLLGITYFRLRRYREARPLLEQAERDSDEDGRASARVFLGLLADESGDNARARNYYALVASSPGGLGASGRLLLERSGPEQWSIVAILRPGYDSNVPLLPATAASPGRGKGSGNGDADLTLIAALAVRPLRAIPLVVDETISYRALAQLTDFNMLGDLVGGTLTLADRCNQGSVAYHFEGSRLGGSRYELGHLLDAAYQRNLHDGYGLRAHYTFNARDYAQAAYAGYSGLTHTASAEGAWGGPGTPHEVSAGYVFSRESTADPALSLTSHGGRVLARIRTSPDSTLRTTVSVAERFYDAAAGGRRDLHVYAETALYVDLSSSLGLVLGGTLTVNDSTLVDETYTKITAFVGLVFAASS